MNENVNYLSLGNIFNLIKSLSKGSSAMQSELFCSLFTVAEINSTTVNNYCVGIRAISIEYKRFYIELKEKYKKDYAVFVPIILSLISILDEHIYIPSDESMKVINSNKNLKELCKNLLKLAKTDENINQNFIFDIKNLLKKNNLYECIITFLLYAVLENKQPIYSQEISIKINKKELDEYLKIKLYDGISYITSMLFLADKGNIYACAEIGSLEYDGLVTGKANYEKSYEYYLMAADKGHPKACWMVAHMILNGKVKYDFDILWKYLNKSIDLGSSAGLNTMGLCYLKGVTPDKKKNKNKARKYFLMASELGYTYAFNNLGHLCEKENDFDEALKYYKISADMGESWALNKVGEYYRKQGDKDKAYIYYLKSSQAPLNERCEWAQGNLDKYYNKNS